MSTTTSSPYTWSPGTSATRSASSRASSRRPARSTWPPTRTARGSPSPGTSWRCWPPGCRCGAWFSTRSPARPSAGRCRSRATSTAAWSTPRRPAASSTGCTATRSAPCCGRRSCPTSRPAGCNRWPPGSWWSGSGPAWPSWPPGGGTWPAASPSGGLRPRGKGSPPVSAPAWSAWTAGAWPRAGTSVKTAASRPLTWCGWTRRRPVSWRPPSRAPTSPCAPWRRSRGGAVPTPRS